MRRQIPGIRAAPPPAAGSVRAGGIRRTVVGRTGSRGLAAAPRAAFTLFEVLLVLAVVVVVIGLTWPSLNWMLEHHRLRQSADLVGTRMGAGRVHALETGLTYQFRYEPGGRRFLLVPFDPEPEQPAGTGETERSSGTRRATRTAGMLPARCAFEGGASFNDKGTAIPDEWLSGLPNAAEYAGALWSPPVLFHPNGTATDFEVRIHDVSKNEVRLVLRAITGGVTVSAVTGR